MKFSQIVCMGVFIEKQGKGIQYILPQKQKLHVFFLINTVFYRFKNCKSSNFSPWCYYNLSSIQIKVNSMDIHDMLIRIVSPGLSCSNSNSLRMTLQHAQSFHTGSKPGVRLCVISQKNHYFIVQRYFLWQKPILFWRRGLSEEAKPIIKFFLHTTSKANLAQSSSYGLSVRSGASSCEVGVA